MYGVFSSKFIDFQIINSKNSLFLYADVLILPYDEVELRNLYVAFNNLSVKNSVYKFAD